MEITEFQKRWLLDLPDLCDAFAQHMADAAPWPFVHRYPVLLVKVFGGGGGEPCAKRRRAVERVDVQDPGRPQLQYFVQAPWKVVCSRTAALSVLCCAKLCTADAGAVISAQMWEQEEGDLAQVASFLTMWMVEDPAQFEPFVGALDLAARMLGSCELALQLRGILSLRSPHVFTPCPRSCAWGFVAALRVEFRR